MSLGEIKNELYKKEIDKEVLEHEKSEFNTKIVAFSSPEKAELPKDDWVEKSEPLEKENKQIVKKGAYILAGLLLVIVLVVGFLKIKQAFFSTDQVIISLDGSTEIKSGNLISYTVKYKNDNRADLKNVTLRLTYPEDFKPEVNNQFKSEGTTSSVAGLPDIKGGDEGSMTFSGRAYSPKGNLIKLKADLVYAPSTISTTFIASAQLVVSVISAPITLEVMAPQNISSDDEVNYLVNYKNEGTESFKNVKVRIDYPERFTFSSSDPRVSEGNNIWYLGDLPGGQSGKVVIVGKLGGERDEVKKAIIKIGADNNGQFVSYNETDVQTKIVSSPLVITQTVNGLSDIVANPGDHLQFEINYKNEGATGLRDVVVTEHLDSPVLDYTTLDLSGGAYDSGSKIITWKAADYSQLKNLTSGQGGVIKFSIRVKDIIPVSNSNDKNFVISSLTKIDSPDIPTPISMNKIISGNKMDIKLNSKLILMVNGFYNDANIPNSGPIPPKVGEETTYTMHFRVLNVSNDVSSAKVETVLPTSVTMTKEFFPQTAPLVYNERTNSIIWTIGNLAAGTGIISDAKEVAFQVKIKPSPDQAGDEAPLLKESIFSANDLFTEENISAKVEGKSTHLLEDAALGTNYKVVN
ncbi:MAG: hypothetical protein WC848_00350 [Parcubacteria group bacterium]|jgi:hypothetical protein